MWGELLFLFNHVYYGSIRGNYFFILGGLLFWCCVVHFFWFVCFLQNNKHSSNKFFLEDLVALRRAYKNYQLLLICWLAGYWSPDASWSGCVIDVSSGWN